MERARTAPTAAVAPDLHLRQRQVADKPEVGEFVEYYMKNGAKLSREVKYVPLPNRAYDAQPGMVNGQGKKGTKFGGENKVGLTIDELMKREAKL
jgi:phosphate transport system substrate-binding protein